MRDEMTGHGFRAMACTCLNELGWHPDVIELQMAHAERNKVRAAYNRAERLADRRRMMQAWADYLEGLRGSYQKARVVEEVEKRMDRGMEYEHQVQRLTNPHKSGRKRNPWTSQLELFSRPSDD